jgi:hypothetical protein
MKKAALLGLLTAAILSGLAMTFGSGVTQGSGSTTPANLKHPVPVATYTPLGFCADCT